MNIIKFTRHGLIYHYLSDTSVDLTGEYVPLADAAALAAERDALKIQADGLKQHAAQSLVKYADAGVECEGLRAERDVLQAKVDALILFVNGKLTRAEMERRLEGVVLS